MTLLAGVELGGTTWLLTIADSKDPETFLVPPHSIDTEEVAENTVNAAIAWLRKQYAELQFGAIGIASFGPVDLDPASPTYGFITSTPKKGWKNTDIVGPFKKAFPEIPIGFETDVNAPALYEVAHGGHGDISSACYITVGPGVGVGVCVDGKAIHGFMHPEGGHTLVPLAEADIKAGFKGTCPFHGSCIEGMVASNSIATRKGIDRRQLQTISDDDEVWDTLAHYLAILCVNLTLTVSPQVIVIGGGIARRALLFDKIREKFVKVLNSYVRFPPIEQYIKPSFHPSIGLVSSLELARLQLE